MSKLKAIMKVTGMDKKAVKAAKKELKPVAKGKATLTASGVKRKK